MAAWLRASRGDWCLVAGGHRWTVRPVQGGSGVKLWWPYCDGRRVLRGTGYDTAASFTSCAAAKAFVEERAQ
jgi:hypothetical protein